MVLSEETEDLVAFQFKGNRWALATFIPGVILLGIAVRLYFTENPQNVLLAIVGIFGLMLIYSSVYSLTSVQWLTADSKTKAVKFYKKNIYGLVEWEKQGDDFKEIAVWRNSGSTNWAISLVCNDGYELYIGENVFGALSYEKALAIANKVSSRTGIRINSPNKIY